MKCFHWEFIKSHVNITHLIAFSLGVIVICFLDALVFEKSIADWVSATSTFGTLAIAYAAYRKAPEWLEKKLDEESISLGIDIHFILHNDIANESIRIRNILYHNDKPAPFSTKLMEIFNPNKKLGLAKIKGLKSELIQNLENDAFSELAKHQIIFVKKLSLLRFMRWKPTGNNQCLISQINERINKICSSRYELGVLINQLLPMIESTESPKDIYDTLKKIEYREEAMINNTKKLLNHIDEYKGQHGDIIDYFERNDKKPVNR